MNDPDDESLESTNVCPFCKSSGSCEHLLLIVDLTFRTADGGSLYDVFRDRWAEVSERNEEDFAEDMEFNNLLEEVDSLSDASSSYVVAGGPGMTSEYGIYFCSTKTRTEAAVAAFQAKMEEQLNPDGDRCAFCQKLNLPAAGETCEHHVGWNWDGTFELEANLEALQRSWQEAVELLHTLTGTSDFDAQVAGLVGRSVVRQKLVDLAAADADFCELVAALEIEIGDGWQTGGVFGGSGYNLYAEDLQSAIDATAFYDGMISAAGRLNASATTEPSGTTVAQGKCGQTRSVLVVVTKWPGGTMAMKLGCALRAALKATPNALQVVEMEPERIFRAQTSVSEADFRKSLAKREVSCPGRVLFIEL